MYWFFYSINPQFKAQIRIFNNVYTNKQEDMDMFISIPTAMLSPSATFTTITLTQAYPWRSHDNFPFLSP